jgi:hypothetical protein
MIVASLLCLDLRQGEKGEGGRDGEHGRKGDTGQKGERGYPGEKGHKGTMVSRTINCFFK